MANNSNLKQLSFVLIFVLTICLQQTKSMPFSVLGENCGYIPETTPRDCIHGSHVVNDTNTGCPTREFCYVGLGEPCDARPERTCAPRLSCKCGECMNCIKGKCNMKLCQQTNKGLKRWITPYEKIWLRFYNNRGDAKFADPEYYY